MAVPVCSWRNADKPSCEKEKWKTANFNRYSSFYSPLDITMFIITNDKRRYTDILSQAFRIHIEIYCPPYDPNRFMIGVTRTKYRVQL